MSARTEQLPNRFAQAERCEVRGIVDHLSIDEATFDDLRRFFSEAQVVELGMFIAFFIGFGRLAAAWDMTEELPAAFQDKSTGRLSPWNHDAVLVRG